MGRSGICRDECDDGRDGFFNSVNCQSHRHANDLRGAFGFRRNRLYLDAFVHEYLRSFSVYGRGRHRLVGDHHDSVYYDDFDCFTEKNRRLYGIAQRFYLYSTDYEQS